MKGKQARGLEIPILEAFPRVAEFYTHPATTSCAFLALVVTLASSAGLDVSALHFDVRFVMQPWRMVTSALPHVGAIHLAFNLYWLWRFGTVVEEMLGWWRYLAMIVTVAVGSAAAEYALVLGGVGLSGVVYALLGFLWVNRGASAKTLSLMSRPIVLLFVVWFFLCIALTAATPLAFANVAHALGAVLGVSVGCMHGASPWGRRALLTATSLVVAASIAAVGLRPHVNITPVRAAGADAYSGYAALSQGRDLEAATLLTEAVTLDGTVRSSWMNLGVALQRMGRATPALDAYEHALALDPGTPNDRRSIAALYVSLGRAAQTSGRHKDAVDLFRRAVVLRGDDSATWRALAVSLEHIGARDEALAAARHAETGTPSSADR